MIGVKLGIQGIFTLTRLHRYCCEYLAITMPLSNTAQASNYAVSSEDLGGGLKKVQDLHTIPLWDLVPR
jgi:hypothetical protein